MRYNLKMHKWALSFFGRSFSHRLVGVGILLLLPLLFVCSSLIIKQNQDIKATQIEIEGVKLAQIAISLKASLTKELTNIAILEKNNRSYAVGLEKLKSLKNSNKLRPHTLAALSGVEIALKSLENINDAKKTDPEIIKKSVNMLIRAISIEYELIIDPKLDSYSLVDFSILHSPDLMDSLQAFSVEKFKNQNEKIININTGKLSAYFDYYFSAASRAINYIDNPSSVTQITNSLQSTKTIIAHLQGDETINSKEINLAATKIEETTDIAIALLEKTLEKRRDSLITNEIIISGTGILLFLIAFLIIYKSLKSGIIRPIEDLTQSMRHISLGNLNQEIDDLNRRDEVGEMKRALKILRDNSVARINAEESAKAKSEFLAVMSHEIRTPMNGVLGMAQALQGSELTNNQRDMLSIIIDSGQTMVTLLNDILDMSKIEAGKIEVEDIKMSPCAMIKSTLELFKNRSDLSKIIFKYEIAENAKGWYMGDPNRISQLLNNLVSNAVKFTHEGIVTIALSQPETNKLRFSVIDTGIGIPSDKLGLLFQKFTQLDSSHTRIYGGSGLGLSICAGLVKAMKGNIWVESEEGKGSSFSFEIPAIEIAPPKEIDCDKCYSCENEKCIDTQETKIQKNIAPFDEASDSIRILVADDNETNRIVLKTIFEKMGIVPDFAYNGQVAFEAWVGQHYDIVLMDMQMPVWDGITAIKAIREWENKYRRKRTPILALSANAMDHQIEEQLNAGADGFCEKPIIIDVLMNEMNNAIEKCENMIEPKTQKMG